MNAHWSPLFRTSLWCWPLLMLTDCSVEERTLEFGFAVGSKSHSEAGSSGGDESEASGGDGGSSGAVGPGNGGDPAAPVGGRPPASGGAPADGGDGVGATGGSSMAGGAGGNGGAASGSAGSGGSPNGGAGGSSGTGGNPDVGTCGDIDLNGVEDCDETLVANASFGQAVAEWTAEANINQAWSASDARGKPSSGSIIITNAKPGQGDGWGVAGTGQCLPAAGGEVYEIGARAQIPAGQAQGRATIMLAIFGNDDCQGTFLKSATPALLAATGDWQVLRGSAKMPPATRSFYVRLAAEKPNAQPSLEVRFDDVLVRQK